MLKTTIWTSDGEDDTRLGDITWDGKTLKAVPDNAPMRNILEEPIFVRSNGTGMAEQVSPKTNPEAFVRGLHKHYKSAYLRASTAQEV